MINPTRLLFELQKIERINQSLSACLEPKEIATKVTDSLVEQFSCSFARIWLVQSDRTVLNLVASSGLYTRLDGDFAKVPMGSYKVGKIAQHSIPFLSNQLAEEPWVKDRQWAIDNKIYGFAGLPIFIGKKVIGVLAVFSHQPLEMEFLEALKILCSSLAVLLNYAQLYQEKFRVQHHSNSRKIALSEQISSILPNVGLVLVGTEKSLNTAGTYIVLKTVEILQGNHCNYCRLTYKKKMLCLEAMLVLNPNLRAENIFSEITCALNNLDGQLEINVDDNNITQIELSLLYEPQKQKEVNLSRREQEIIQLLASGMRDLEIAAKLFISDRTVKFHINNVVKKLNSSTRIQAVYQAYNQGLLDSV